MPRSECTQRGKAAWLADRGVVGGAGARALPAGDGGGAVERTSCRVQGVQRRVEQIPRKARLLVQWRINARAQTTADVATAVAGAPGSKAAGSVGERAASGGCAALGGAGTVPGGGAANGDGPPRGDGSTVAVAAAADDVAGGLLSGCKGAREHALHQYKVTRHKKGCACRSGRSAVMRKGAQPRQHKPFCGCLA